MSDYKIYSTFGDNSLNMMGGNLDKEGAMNFVNILLFIIVIYIIYKMNDKQDLLLRKIFSSEKRKKREKREKKDEIKKDIVEKSINNYQDNIQNQDPRNLKINILQEKKSLYEPPIHPFEIMRDYDYRTLNDPLVAPRRRDDYNLPVLPLPTRGFPAPYKKMGLLIDKSAPNDDRYKILLLMGRNKHPNSTVYDYYAVENDKNSSLKFDIDKTRELQSDDKVKINELGKIYTVIIDKILGYEYDPYFY
jgi:hypothetical protein